MKIKTMHLSVWLGALGAISAVAQTPVAPKFQEVYQILSTNLEGFDAAQLDRAAVLGLVHQLAPRVSLAAPPADSPKAAPLAEVRVFDNSFAYFRVASVTPGLPEAFRAAYQQVCQTNKSKLRGLALDLRFAGGSDYPAAAKMADLFLSSDHPLLNWLTGSARATLKADAITLPVTILVNSQTAAAAEALAAVLRDTGVGLILGGQTAGQASIYKEFPLSDGGTLRVAVAPVTFCAGNTLSRGVTPDIAISSSLDDERAYLLDPYKDLHPLPTAGRDTAAKELAEQPRLNETELIREHRDGDDADASFNRDLLVNPEPAPSVADPALARALDLLKGLAVVQPNRPG